MESVLKKTGERKKNGVVISSAASDLPNGNIIGLKGLTSEEAEKRLSEYGLNSLEQKKKRKALKMFAGQFKDVMVMILLAATVISAVMGEY